MAGAFKAGTVFVDVVPSMKGFYKTVVSDAKQSMPSAGNEAGKAYAESFRKTAADAGKSVVNAIADPLGKSTARLEAEARQAGQALSAAQGAVTESSQKLAAARAQESSAASDVTAAEQALNRVRSSGAASTQDVARAQDAYRAAVERSSTANRNADSAAAALAKAQGDLEQASAGARDAEDALAVATGRAMTSARQAQPAAGSLADALDDVDREAGEASDSMEGTGRSSSSMAGLVRSSVGPLLALAAAVGIGGFASEAITASDATDKFISTLQFAGIDDSTISRLTQSAKDYADATVYDLADIQSITAQLASNGVEGFDSLAEAAGNLNAVAGGNAQTFQSVGMVLTQTAGQGKLTTENFNQLSDAIPGASGKIQEALLEAGAYTGNFREALEKGEISAEEFNAAVLTLGSTETAQAAARSTETIEGAARNLQATIVGGFKEFIDWVKPSVTSAMNGVAEAFSSAFTWVKENKDLVLALAAGVGVAVAAYGAFSILQQVRTWLAATTLAQQGLNAAMKANIIGIIVTAIAALVTGLVLLYQRNEDFRAQVQELGATVRQVWEEHIQPALSALWSWITGTLAPALSDFWTGTVKPVWEGFASAVSTAWNDYIYPALSALWSWITETLAPALSEFWTGTVQPVWNAISAAVTEAWNTYIQPALSALWSWITETLAPALSEFWTGTVQPVWDAISNFIQSAWVNVIQPAIQGWWLIITNVIGPAIMWFWSNVIQPAWTAISWVISFAWDYVIKPALTALWWFVSTVLGPTFMWLWNNVVQPAWDGISSVISTVVNFVSDTVLPKLTTAIDNAKTGFDNFKSGVETAMDGIKSAAAKPINFVINTVYTDGIKAMFDTVAEKVGLSLRLPSVNPIPGYAEGGRWRTMTPGYTPGKDVYHFFSPDGGGAIRLSGGEGIIRPDALRALGGKAWLDAVNASRGRGLSTVGDGGSRRGQVAFAEGGIWGSLRGGLEAAKDWVVGTASAVADIVSDPLGAITNLVIQPAKDLLATMGSSYWDQVAQETPPLWFEALKDIFKTKVDEEGLGSAAGLAGAARKALGVPYVWGGSTIPPGLDCSGLVYWAAQQLGLGWPRLTAAGYQSGSTSVSSPLPGDLIFWGNPAYHVAIVSGPGMMLEEPQPGGVAQEVPIRPNSGYGRYGGRQYDVGGWLPPGVTAAVNQTGAREAVLTSRQWRDVSVLAANGTTGLNLDGAELRLVLDDRTALDAHIEVVSMGVSRRAAALQGRGR